MILFNRKNPSLTSVICWIYLKVDNTTNIIDINQLFGHNYTWLQFTRKARRLNIGRLGFLSVLILYSAAHVLNRHLVILGDIRRWSVLYFVKYPSWCAYLQNRPRKMSVF